MKSARRAARSIGFATLATVAALSLTACDGDDSQAAAGPSASTSASPSASTDASASPEASKESESGDSGSDKAGSTGSTSSGSTGGSGSSGSSGGSSSTGGSGSTGGSSSSGSTGGGSSTDDDEDVPEARSCDTSSVSVKLEATGGTVPAAILKATNKTSTACSLHGFPFVGWPNAQAPLFEATSTAYNAGIFLEPGATAYSSIRLETGDANNMHREKSITVQFGDSQQRAIGGTATLSAPGSAGIALSDKSTVTYWVDTLELAMR
ncbi:DUF4232 domain-containing protein [Streptomyces sp. NPDC093109]|uniref:DUF4232 domain-containing protein n=1 Tax=Streptomyces sp. NPDC093109 TaxID=3154977 RepID=UPI00344FBB8F